MEPLCVPVKPLWTSVSSVFALYLVGAAEPEAGAAVGCLLAQEDGGAGKGGAGQRPDGGVHVGDVRVGELVAHAHGGRHGGFHFGKVAGVEVAGDHQAMLPVQLRRGDDAALLARVVTVPAGLVVDCHAEERGQGRLRRGARQHDAMAASAARGSVGGRVDEGEAALEGQAVGVTGDLGDLDGHGAQVEGARQGAATGPAAGKDGSSRGWLRVRRTPRRRGRLRLDLRLDLHLGLRLGHAPSPFATRP